MSMKVFELAKELDMGAIDLVETLKSNGLQVRNHMAMLSDEDLVKIRTEIFKSPEAQEKKAKTAKKSKAKTVKKKVVRKKTVKKTATQVASKVDEASEDTGKDSAAPKKKATVKKKTVVRRRASSNSVSDEDKKETSEQNLASVESSPEEVKSQVSKTEPKETSEVDNGNGLRVVALPEKKEVKATEKEEKKTASNENKKEYLKETVHRFTPVYIPEAKKEEGEKEESNSTTARKKTFTNHAPSTTEAENESSSKGKKRLSGLASMMSGKKDINRSQALTQSRADSELKSYQSLSGLGMPVYTVPKRKRIYTGPSKKTKITEVKDSKRIVKLHGGAKAVDLAKKLNVKFKELVDKCLDINLLLNQDDFIGMILAEEIASLYNYKVEDVSFNEDKVIGKTEDKKEKSNDPARSPVIAIMGHVDHGKTTLLDYIREAKIASGEAGGITQHIGAYSVQTKNKSLTFLDTPGHAAFASMRQRGADITDLVVLVVAADDSVMPQTRESVKYCRNADVPMIVAINKMDKEGANPDRVKSELAELGISPEEWGGDTQFVPISALNGDGVDDLLEAISLQAEILELTACPKGKATGVVIESKIEQGRGPVATVLVQSGTLKKGESIVVGETFGRARSLTNHLGQQLKDAGPSTPVQILGLDNAPSPGDTLDVVKNEREAKKIVSNRAQLRKKNEEKPVKKISLEDFFGTAPSDSTETKTLNLIVRADVQGSFEAIKQSLEPLSTNEVEVKVLDGGVGAISENDVKLASSSGAYIIGFNMRPVTTARKLSEELGIDIKTYSVIYELINDIKLSVEGLFEPEFTEKYIGRAEVKETFSVPKIGVIAGSVVVEGKIAVGCNVRLLRSGKIVHDGKMSSLKRFKDDVKEVKVGVECGIGLEGYTDIKIGDLFECYIMEEKKLSYEDVLKAEGRVENHHGY